MAAIDYTISTPLYTLPNEILVQILTPFTTRALLPLASVSHRFHAVVLRILHYRLLLISSLKDYTLLLECFHPISKLTDPHFFCTYLGTPGLNDKYEGPGSLYESCTKTSEYLGRLSNVYSCFRPEIDASETRDEDDGNNDEIETPMLVKKQVSLEEFEDFSQLCSIVNLVKIMPNSRMLISAVTVEDGIIRVFRDWLKRQSKRDQYSTTTTSTTTTAAHTGIQQDEDDVLWVNNKKTVGLKLRVKEKRWNRPMLPVLMHRDEEGANHDWSTCRNLPAQWWSRSYHQESQHADRKPASTSASTWTEPLSKSHDRSSGRQRALEKMADKEFFLSLLSSAATKREAKAYLSRFPSIRKTKVPTTRHKETTVELQPSKEIEKPGVNLGSFYGATRSVLETPVFRQGSTPEIETAISIDEALHVALVKLSNAQSLDDETLHGVATTLSQLTRLGMASCVVVDPGPVEDEAAWRKAAAEQADRLSAAIDACDGGKARRLDSVLVRNKDGELPKVISRQVLLRPLRKNHIVVVTPVAYSDQTSGLEREHDPDEDPRITAEKFAALQKEVSIDRLIVLDPVGGIPAFKGPQRSHVFVNMEQEFRDIEAELLEAMASFEYVDPGTEDLSVAATKNNPISNFVATEVAPLPQQQHKPVLENGVNNSAIKGHIENLRLLQQTLTLLPPSSSGIITTPGDVANSARPLQDVLSVSQVGTRRSKNPLIHNLLTDKPVYSSSLPSERLGQTTPSIVQSTFLKRGMPLTILPDPRITPWSPDSPAGQHLTLDDPRIDLPRLVHLIEDSFDRKLDVQDYLNRVNGRLAGLIIAGEYEGGAILTWETPPSIPESERNNPENVHRLVPYLDKFAVLKRSQGAGGVADVVFNAMVRSCLPRGVCWRSRMDNPVNKWYFERSRGTWKLNGSNWAMFWTTPGVPEDDPLKFKDYEAVCRSIQPSWADKKAVVD
ncbi:uncharacterized protein BHQ10_006083 [Talaromyces amestolkiae]|uniref:Amino-acid acetyltransferase, mitochondrial n=1 Tax=Talaromyces amestolkiae TaxID=1196081 RepID=A0A364L2Y1_TALAM|nr:uncharacterized protein BHQ10_006083 [Talaromyces amestolkiae]RAO70071.1 hypothetical protein BHQ10_006083 [Talaromyces amestolkiae]